MKQSSQFIESEFEKAREEAMLRGQRKSVGLIRMENNENYSSRRQSQEYNQG